MAPPDDRHLMDAPGSRTELGIRSSVPLTDDEIGLVTETLPELPALRRADPVAPDLDALGEATPADLASSSQYLLGLDPAMILAVAIGPLPGIIVKKIADDAAGEFWPAAKRLLRRVRERKRGVPISSLQVRVRVERRERVQAEVVLTALDADFASEAEWTPKAAAAFRAAAAELDKLDEAAGEPDPQAPSKTIVVHALLDGGGQTKVHATAVEP